MISICCTEWAGAKVELFTYKKFEEDAYRICDELNAYLMPTFKYKTPVARLDNMDWRIFAYRRKVNLMLRLTKEGLYVFAPNTMVIARIYFQERRSGHGTKLLKLLTNIAEKYEYTSIGIEKLNPAAAGFAEHFGFNVLEGNHWVISTNKLRRFFSGGHDNCLYPDQPTSII